MQIIHARRHINAMIMATTFRANAQKEEAVLIAAKPPERYVPMDFVNYSPLHFIDLTEKCQLHVFN